MKRQEPDRPALQGPRRDERRAALGDHDEPGDAHAAAGRAVDDAADADRRSSRMLMGEKVGAAQGLHQDRGPQGRRTLTSDLRDPAHDLSAPPAHVYRVRVRTPQLLRVRRPQRPRPPRSTCTSAMAGAWTELVLDFRFEGWAGVTHGGIIAAILDEVMAWALVAAGQLGRDRPAERRASRRRSRSASASARKAGSPTFTGAIFARGRPGARRGDRRRAVHGRGDLRRRRRGAAGRAPGALPAAARARSPRTTWPSCRWGDDDALAHHGSGAARSWRSTARPRRPWATDWPSLVADPERFERTLTSGFRRLADPDYAAAQPTDRARLRAAARRALAARPNGGAQGRPRAGGAVTGHRRVPRRAAGSRPSCSRCAGSPFGPPTASWPATRSGPGRSSAARPARQPTGSRVDTLAHPYRPRHPARAVSLGRARAARLLAAPVGASAGRLHGRRRCPFVTPPPSARDRRSPDAGAGPDRDD